MSSRLNPVSTKVIISCTIGTFLEFFDYTLYGYFASTIGRLFFPTQSQAIQLLATWGIFSIGFLARPFGALLFGSLADKKGRRKVFPFTIALMAVPTVCIGLLPTFATLGWLAPLLLLLCRIVQGLAVSAEYNGTSIYILENNWPRRGFLGSLSPFSGGMGMLAASFLTYLFTHTGTDLTVWQWRLPFIFAGLLVGGIGWYLRRTLQETPGFLALEQSKKLSRHPCREVLRENKAALFTNIICSAYMGSASYLLLVYMSTYLHEQFALSLSAALIFTSLAAFIESNCTLLFGWISDSFGRAQTLFLASFFTVVAAVIFVYETDLSIYRLIIDLFIFVILLGAFDGPLTMYLPELFKTNIRYSGTTLGYNLGGAALGGFAPLILSILLSHYHHPRIVLGVYLGVFAAFSCIAIAVRGFSRTVNQTEWVMAPKLTNG